MKPAEDNPGPTERLLSIFVILGLCLSLLSSYCTGSIVLAVMVLCGLGTFLLVVSLPCRTRESLRACGAFLACLLPSLVFSPVLHLSLVGYTRIMALMGYFLGAVRLASRERERKILLGVMVLFTLLLSVNGLSQMIFPERMPSHWVGVSQGESLPFRVSSFFVNPNLWGAFCAMACSVLVLASAYARNKSTGRFYAVFAMLVLVNLVASFSRGAWIAFAAACLVSFVVLLWLGLRFDSRRITAACVITVIVALYLPSVRARLGSLGTPGEFGMRQRMLLYRGVLAHIRDNLPLGSGLRSFQTLFPRYRKAGGQYVYEAHSDLLGFAAECGLPGIVAYLAFIFFIARLFLRRARDLPDFSCPGFALLVSYLFISQAVTVFHYSFLALPFLVTLGLCSGAVDQSAKPLLNLPQRKIVFMVAAFVFLSCVFYWYTVVTADNDIERFNRFRNLASRESAASRRACFDQALKAARSALGRNPLRDDSNYYLALALIDKAQGCTAGERSAFLDEAWSFCERARKLNPYEALYTGTMAEICLLQGKPRKAVLFVDKALADDPYSESLLRKKALILERLGRTDEAVAILERALSTNPQFLKVNRQAYLPVLAELLRILKEKGDLDAYLEISSRYSVLLKGKSCKSCR